MPRSPVHHHGPRTPTNKTVVIAVPASDCHVVALKLLEWYLSHAGYHVVNLGVTTTNQEIAEAVYTYSPIAVLISSQNGHAEIDLQGLQSQLRGEAADIPILIGGRLSITADSNHTTLVARFATLGITVVESFESALCLLTALASPHNTPQLRAPGEAA